MQRTIRVNENQLLNLSERAHYDHSLAGYLHKRTADSTKWQSRWFVLYQVSTSSASLMGQKLTAGKSKWLSISESTVVTNELWRCESLFFY